VENDGGLIEVVGASNIDNRRLRLPLLLVQVSRKRPGKKNA
jgi:hypothetical protein